MPQALERVREAANERFYVNAPEVGARCPNWARRDLCGGRGVTRVPTAIEGTKDFNKFLVPLW